MKGYLDGEVREGVMHARDEALYFGERYGRQTTCCHSCAVKLFGTFQAFFATTVVIGLSSGRLYSMDWAPLASRQSNYACRAK